MVIKRAKEFGSGWKLVIVVHGSGWLAQLCIINIIKLICGLILIRLTLCYRGSIDRVGSGLDKTIVPAKFLSG